MIKSMETSNTKIIPREIEYNSPKNYDIFSKETGELIDFIEFQKGAIKDGINGVFIEDLLLICIDQLEHFQNSDFACENNEATLRHLRDALATTRARQYERQLRGVQGVYKK